MHIKFRATPLGKSIIGCIPVYFCGSDAHYQQELTEGQPNAGMTDFSSIT